MSTLQARKKAEKALSEEKLSDAVEALKKGLNRDPYWSWGHLKLGDIYLIELDHPVYALVEYRKLQKVKDALTGSEKIRLAWAYHQRSFDDKAREILTGIEIEDLPDELEIFDRKIKTEEKFRQLNSEVQKNVAEDSDDYFKKHFRQGNEFLNAGNFYRAQQAYEEALQFKNSSEAKLNLARCLIERVKFPAAVRQLKKLLNDEHVHDKARKLLTSVYRRLGLPVSKLNSDVKEDENDSRSAAGA